MLRQAGIRVGICSELASSPLVITILLELGVDELRMNLTAIGVVKTAILQFTMEEAEAMLLEFCN